MSEKVQRELEKLQARGIRVPDEFLSTVVIVGSGQAVTLYDLIDQCVLLSVRRLDDGKPSFVFGAKGIAGMLAKIVGVEKAKVFIKVLADQPITDEPKFTVTIDKYANKHKAK